MKKQAQAGEIDLAFLDESGFAPTFPTSYTWARRGVRAIVPYEAPERRRVNVLGALLPWATETRFIYQSFTHTIKAPHFVEFVWSTLAGMSTPVGEVPEGFQRPRPCVIVLDNYSVHKAQEVKAHIEAFAKVGISFFFLPPYSPELNLIEPLWRHLKHEEIPVRSHATLESLKLAVDAALQARQHRLAASSAASTDHLSTISLPVAA